MRRAFSPVSVMVLNRPIDNLLPTAANHGNMASLFRLLSFSSAAVLAGFWSGAQGVRTIIPTTSFDSQADFDADWNYLYPWGSDHNGAARMDKAHVKFGDGMVTLTAERVTGQPQASHGGKKIDIKYLSGAIHAKEHFNVSKGGGYDFTGEFKATTTKGTWPAYWTSSTTQWPPEIDLAEWKGSGKISFNTFNTSSQVTTKDVNYPTPNNFHKIKCEVRDVNGKDVSIKFFMDGNLVTTQVGKGFFGKPMYLYVAGSRRDGCDADISIALSIYRWKDHLDLLDLAAVRNIRSLCSPVDMLTISRNGVCG
jgi:galactan endo-beta-1,3-galactanase